MSKKKVLFVCTHNSARSQIAEGLLRALYGEHYEVYSAGTEARGVHPFAIQVMKEIGIDISSQKSKTLDVYSGWTFDYVVTVCDSARENCPYFPGAKKYIHQSFSDPSNLALSQEEQIVKFREVRDKIYQWLKDTFHPNV